MAAPSMAEVLAKHAYGAGSQGRYCQCGAMGQGDRQANHAAHVARALAAAGFGHVASVEAERDGNARAARALIRGQAELGRRLAATEAQVAAVRALADEWGISSTDGGFVGDADFAEALRESGAWRFARDLRRALDGEATP